nr:uncharacterized protein LOC129283348 [Lytechinus pictus]
MWDGLLKDILGQASGSQEQSHLLHDPHDGDESDLRDWTAFPTFSDFSDREVPDPCEFVSVDTQPLEKRKLPAFDGNPRKKKRKRRRSGHGTEGPDQSTQSTQPTQPSQSTQTPAPPERTFENAEVQTEKEDCVDCSTQCPESECEVASPSYDHEYASSMPDDPALLKIDAASIVEEEASREKMEVPPLVMNPTPAMPAPTETLPLYLTKGPEEEARREKMQVPPAVVFPSLEMPAPTETRRSIQRKVPEHPVTSHYTGHLSSPSSHVQTQSSSGEQASSSSGKDPSYVPSSDHSSDVDEEEQKWLEYCSDPKYVVFGAQLERLFYSLKCSKCFGSEGHISDLQKHVQGTHLTVSAFCVCGNLVIRWDSQPKIGHAPVGNLLCTASALFSGQTHESLNFFSSVLSLEFIGNSLFYDIQDEWLFSALNSAFKANIAEARREVGQDPVILCGDGRCDSPGFSAKYCTYTLMNAKNNKIMAMKLVQVSEASSSVAMEKLGFQRALQELLDAGINVTVVATDRHVGIRKLMREEYPHIIHQFDVWHVEKAVKKRLLAKSKRKENALLGPWISCIGNHLWWSASNCNENPDLLIEMWQSVTHHICNIHEWNSADMYHQCRHDPLPPDEERETKWLTPDSPPHQALQDVLFDRNLVKDIRQLTMACRTGDLESYHSMLLKYCPKRKHFPYAGMMARTQLAVLDHNHNQNRGQRVIKKGPRRGEGQYKVKYSKRAQSWAVNINKEDKNFSYLIGILQDVLQMRGGEKEVQPVEIPELPVHVAKVPCPPKEDLISKKFSRFKK